MRALVLLLSLVVVACTGRPPAREGEGDLGEGEGEGGEGEGDLGEGEGDLGEGEGDLGEGEGEGEGEIAGEGEGEDEAPGSNPTRVESLPFSRVVDLTPAGDVDCFRINLPEASSVVVSAYQDEGTLCGEGVVTQVSLRPEGTFAETIIGGRNCADGRADFGRGEVVACLLSNAMAPSEVLGVHLKVSAVPLAVIDEAGDFSDPSALLPPFFDLDPALDIDCFELTAPTTGTYEIVTNDGTPGGCPGVTNLLVFRSPTDVMPAFNSRGGAGMACSRLELNFTAGSVYTACVAAPEGPLRGISLQSSSAGGGGGTGESQQPGGDYVGDATGALSPLPFSTTLDLPVGDVDCFTFELAEASVLSFDTDDGNVGSCPADFNTAATWSTEVGTFSGEIDVDPIDGCVGLRGPRALRVGRGRFTICVSESGGDTALHGVHVEASAVPLGIVDEAGDRFHPAPVPSPPFNIDPALDVDCFAFTALTSGPRTVSTAGCGGVTSLAVVDGGEVSSLVSRGDCAVAEVDFTAGVERTLCVGGNGVDVVSNVTLNIGDVNISDFRLDPLVYRGTLGVFATVEGEAHCDLLMAGQTVSLPDVQAPPGGDPGGGGEPDGGFNGPEPATWNVEVTDELFLAALSARSDTSTVEGRLRCHAVARAALVVEASAISPLSIGLPALPVPVLNTSGDVLRVCLDLPMCGDPRLPPCSCTIDGKNADANFCGADVPLSEAGLHNTLDELRFIDVSCAWLDESTFFPLRLQRLEVVYGSALTANPPRLPEEGGSTTLSWDPTGGQESCEVVNVSNGEIVGEGVAGSVLVTLSEATTYRLVCHLGVETNFEDLIVAAGVQILNFDVSRTDLAHLAANYQVVGATDCSLTVDGGNARPVPVSGPLPIVNNAAVAERQTTLDLRCTNGTNVATRREVFTSAAVASTELPGDSPGPAMSDFIDFHPSGLWRLRVRNADSCDLEQEGLFALRDLPNVADFPLPEEDNALPFLLTCRSDGITRSVSFGGIFPHAPPHPITINVDTGDGAPACTDGDFGCWGDGATVDCDRGSLALFACAPSATCQGEGICVLDPAEGESDRTDGPLVPFAPLARHLPEGGGVVDVCLSEPLVQPCRVVARDPLLGGFFFDEVIPGLHRCLSDGPAVLSIPDDAVVSVDCRGLTSEVVPLTVGPTITLFETQPPVDAGVPRGSTLQVRYETLDVLSCTLKNNGVVVATGLDVSVSVVADVDGELLLECSDGSGGTLSRTLAFQVGP